ncbi:MAG: WD40/YVTN/BNR-like repeat-containing protein, partial [Chitinophagales bacterium]
MKRLRFVLLFVLIVISYSESFAQSPKVELYSVFDLKVNVTIRAIEAVNDSTLWFSASGGTYGYTNDGGKHWKIDSMKIESTTPDFRSLAVLNDSTVLLLNAGSPAFIMKSTNRGKKWRSVYENHLKEIFFDAMKFSDEKNGFALADPIDGQFQILATNDGGDHWQMNKNLPSAFMGEACFASSNSSLSITKNSLWIGTGASYNRVLSFGNESRHWSSSTALVQCCGSLQGIFSLDFYDDQNGIVVGGDYSRKNKMDSTAAITHDGGKTWKIVSSGILPMGSCVKFQPASSAKTIFVACLPGIYFSDDGGENWKKLKDENGKEINDSYYVLDFSPSGKIVWLA